MISTTASLFDYRPGTLLRVTGEDAFNFLQGQFTNELRQPPESATYGLWLNQKGKILADSHVLRVSEDEFLIASEISPVAVIKPRLEEYIVADEVGLADETATTQGLLLGGAPGGAIIKELLGAVPAPGRFSTTTDWPHCWVSPCATMRATMSLPPPGASGTIMRTGLEGYLAAFPFCARAMGPAGNTAERKTAIAAA